MKTFEKFLTEKSFSDRQKSEMQDILNRNFGSKKRSKETAGKVIKDTAQKNVKRVLEGGKKVNKTINLNAPKKSGTTIKSKGGDATTGGGSKTGNITVSSTTGAKKNNIPPTDKKIISQRRTAQDNQQQRFNRQYDAYDDGDLGNPSQSKSKTVNQAKVSKDAKEFTKDINKANVKRQETVAKRKYHRGKKATRIANATGGKKTGSLRRGNLSFPGDRSGAYSTTKADIEARRGLRSAGASGDFSPTMPQDKRKSKQKIRDTRVKKYKTPDPFKIDTSKAAKEVAKDFGTKPVKGGIDFGKPGTGVKDAIKDFQPRDTSTRRAAEKAEKSFKAFQDRLSKQSANIKQSKIYVKPKSASASTGGGANYSGTSFRTGNMKSGRTSSRKPFDSMGGGRKPPFGGGKSAPMGSPENPEIVSGKFIRSGSKPKVSKIPKTRGGGKIGSILAVAATAPFVYDKIKSRVNQNKQNKGKKNYLDINKDFERVKS